MTENRLARYDKVRHSDGLTIWYENESDEVVCMVSLSEENGQKWIHGIYVAPPYRRIGLCVAILDYATFNGGDHLRARISNGVAIRIYNAYGFRTYDADDKYLYMTTEKRDTNVKR